MLHMPNPMLMGGSDSYDADSLAYFSAMSVQPDSTRKGLIDALIRGLKADGVWAKLDCLWLIAAHDAQAGRVNAKAPSTYALTAVNGPTFVTDRGYSCDGTNDHLLSEYDYASGGAFQQNNAHVAAYLNASSGAASSNTASLGSSSVGANTALRPVVSGNVMPVQLNSSTTFQGPTATSAVGFRLQSRTSSAEILAQADASQTVVTRSSSAPVSAALALMRLGSNYQQGRIAFASVGGGLTASEAVSLRTHLLAYLTVIGAA